MGAFCAIILNIFLPEEYVEEEITEFDPEASTVKVLQDPVHESGKSPETEPLSPRAVAQLNR